MEEWEKWLSYSITDTDFKQEAAKMSDVLYSKFLFLVNKVNIMDDLIIVEAPDFGLSALRGHSCGSWYKSEGFVF